ncbi:hypothetical protein MRO49_25275, partial [Escherichia coli]|uniref:hypothetical protein n=1 Tax=Escherichia coli TaxID=562 RepID=UPI002113F858
KLDLVFELLDVVFVAPHAGAWIETATDCRASGVSPVAPHAGAWIETTARASTGAKCAGRAPRGRVD